MPLSDIYPVWFTVRKVTVLMQVCNVKKLHLQANSAKFLKKSKQQHYCEDLVSGWAILQRTAFNQ